MRTTLTLISLTLLAACNSNERYPPIDSNPTDGGPRKDAKPDIAQDSEPDTDKPDGDDKPDIPCAEDPTQTTIQDECVSLTGPGHTCNPLTSHPCDTQNGETCDYHENAFKCVGKDLPKAGRCAYCGGDPFPEFCDNGFTCLGLNGKCTRYCCQKNQCAFGEECVIQPPTNIGICQANRNDIFANIIGYFDGGTDADPDGDTNPDGPPDPNTPACSFEVAPGSGSCITSLTDPFGCNPFTNEGCTSTQVCELAADKWKCISALEFVGICKPCSPGSCKPGSTCHPTDGCARICCSNDDCSPGICHHEPNDNGVGICFDKPDP